MKRHALIAFALLVAIQLVAADTGSLDNECEARGYDYGLAEWHYSDGAYVLLSQRNGTNITVNGTDSMASWVADRHVNGVITHEGELFFKHFGGTNGLVQKSAEAGIEHITFCARARGSANPTNPPHGVPEFSTITLAIAIIVGGLGLALLRKN